MDRHRQVGEGYNIGARGERTNLHVVERICACSTSSRRRRKSAPRPISDLSTRRLG